MKIKIKQSIMSDLGTFAADSIVDLPDDVATHWIEKDLAISVDEKPKAKPKKEESKEVK